MRDEAKDAWVRRVLQFDLTPAGSARASAADRAERLTAIRDDIALHGATDLQGALGEATAAARAGDPQAPFLISALEDRLAAFVRDKRHAEAAGTVAAEAPSAKVGAVAFAKMRLRLNALRSGFDAAVGNLEAACVALLTTPDFAADPRSSAPETLAAVATIGSRVPALDPVAETVEAAIDPMRGTDDPTLRQHHAAAALKAIDDYRAAIDREPLLTYMQSSDAGSFVIHDALVEPLDELAAALRG